VLVDAGVWDRAAGRALHDVLDSDMPGLPQSEPSGSEKPVRSQIVTETGHRIHIGSFKGYSRNRMETNQVNPAIQSAKQFE